MIASISVAMSLWRNYRTSQPLISICSRARLHIPHRYFNIGRDTAGYQNRASFCAVISHHINRPLFDDFSMLSLHHPSLPAQYHTLMFRNYDNSGWNWPLRYEPSAVQCKRKLSDHCKPTQAKLLSYTHTNCVCRSDPIGRGKWRESKMP